MIRSIGASGYTADSDEVKKEIASNPGLTVDAAIGNLEMRNPITSPIKDNATDTYGVKTDSSNYNQNITDQTGSTGQPTPTAGDIYGNLISQTPEDKAYYAELERMGMESKKTSETVPSEDEIRSKYTNKFQDEIDAMNRLYAEKRRLAEEQISGRSGSATAIQGRRGMIGSTMGAAQKDNLATLGKNEIGAIEAEKTAAIGSILMEIENRASAELAQKTEAAKQGATEYLTYLQGAAQRKSEQIKEVARRAAVSGSDVSDQDIEQMAKSLGIDSSQFKQMYNEQKLANTTTASAPLTEKIGDILYQYNPTTGTWSKAAGETVREAKTQEIDGVLYEKNLETGAWEPVAGKQKMSELELYAAKKSLDKQYEQGELSELELYQAKKAIDASYSQQNEAIKFNTENSAKSANETRMAQAVVDEATEKQTMIDQLLGLVEDTYTVGTTPGMRGESILSPAQATARYIAQSSGKDAEFLAKMKQLISQATLQSLTDAKSQGATFGALSEGEMRVLSNAGSALSGYAIFDDNGGITGFNATPKQITEQLNLIKANLEKVKNNASGALVAEPETIQQTTNDPYSYFEKNPQMQNVFKSEWDKPENASKSLDEMWEGFSQVLGFNGVGGDTEAATKITKIQNKIPQGTKYTKATDGECGYWSRKIVDYPSGTGNTLTEKRNYLAKNGIRPQTWQKEGVKVGDVIITDDSKQWGHVVVVNSINPDGTVTVSESNYAQPYMVTHNRKIPITSPKIQGVVRGKLKNLA
jgi:hypothetical protein